MQGAWTRCPVETKERNNKGVLMKKLMMFAAAMTIVGGAYAADCEREEEDRDCALVYDFKASLKTTSGSYSTLGNVFDPDTCDRGTVTACFRKPGKLNWGGVLYVCECGCEGFQTALLDVWNKKAKTIDAGLAPEWEILNLLGKKGQAVEALWSVEGTGWELRMGGFGKYDGRARALRIKSLSGYAVGSSIAPVCELQCLDALAMVCDAEGWIIDADDVPDTVLVGTWALRYNKKASARYAATGELPTDQFLAW